MEKKVKNAKQFPKSAKPPIEKGETQSKPKTGMGIPFSPKRFKEIYELSQRGPSNKISKS